VLVMTAVLFISPWTIGYKHVDLCIEHNLCLKVYSKILKYKYVIFVTIYRCW